VLETIRLADVWRLRFSWSLPPGKSCSPPIVFSRACSEPNPDYPRWDERRIMDNCWWLLKEGRLKAEEIVRPVVPFDEVLEHYAQIADAPETNLKLGVEF